MIARMLRVEIVGKRRLLPEVLALLQREGTLHLRPCPVPLGEWAQVPLDRTDPETERRLEVARERLSELLRVLPAPREPLVGERLPGLDDPAFPAQLDMLAAELRVLDEHREVLAEERAVLGRYQQLLVALAPLLRQIEDSAQVEAIGILLRRGETAAISALEEAVAHVTGGAYTLVTRPIDADQLGGFLAVPKPLVSAVSQLLFERGVGEVKLPARYQGRSFAEAVRLLVARRREIAADIEGCEAERRAFAARWHDPLADAAREARNRLARLRARALCAETHHSFLVAGWLPLERHDDLARALDGAYGGQVALYARPAARDDWLDVPVVLVNRPLLRPFELLLGLQPLPRYGSVDPTPFLAVFFPLFFGLILGDIGYGAVGLGIALVARRRGWGGALGRKVAIIAAACSISAIVFGILFGELFGELGEAVGLVPILLDRRHQLVPLLGFVVALGALQIGLGLALGALAAWRAGEIRTALARLATLAVLADAAVGVAYRPALWAGAPFVVAAVLLEGPMGPLELVRTAGAVLSYARLMAVGLASVMFAVVANKMAEVVHPAVVGIGLSVLLHAVNFTLGLVSPAIQALRLHYVEFFDKFFVPGGQPYEPLALATSGG